MECYQQQAEHHNRDTNNQDCTSNDRNKKKIIKK